MRRPDEIAAALTWARATSERECVPVVVEILTEMEEDAAMGGSIDAIREVYPPQARVLAG